jgi:hypothetical protein
LATDSRCPKGRPQKLDPLYTSVHECDTALQAVSKAKRLSGITYRACSSLKYARSASTNFPQLCASAFHAAQTRNDSSQLYHHTAKTGAKPPPGVLKFVACP